VVSEDGRIAVGVLGCAGIARRAMLPAMSRSAGVRIAAVASRDADKATEFAAAFDCAAVTGYEELLGRPDIDAVYLPLPTGMHVPWALAALRAGKHVLVEKPLSTNAEGAREVVALAEERGLVVMESFMFLHHGQHTAVAKLVADGVIGEVREFEAVFGIPALPPADIRNRPELGGGALLDLGVYPLRAAQLYLGEGLRVGGATTTADERTGVDVAGAVVLSTADGRIARLSYGMRHHYRSTYALWGDRGRITVERPFTLPATLEPRVVVSGADGEYRVPLPADDHFRNIADHFASVVRSGEGAEQRHRQIVRQAELIDAVRTSATP
jgi:NDP-hexose-3-ketoreductase